MTHESDLLAQELSQVPELRDLADSLAAIESAVERQWSKDYQPWFTDHGPAHSRRVAHTAMAICEFPGVRGDLRLSPLERYVLYVSCWLHDVGMQELQGEVVGEMTGDDYARIRHEHPARTKEALLTRASEFGLPSDPPLVEAVALVAQSHGTRYYTPSIQMLGDMQVVRNQAFRGPLLASLILIADEFDLHYERAVTLPGGGSLPGISEAHTFKHRCVRSALPCVSPSGEIGLRLELTFPDDLPEDDRLAVERWICLKVQHQMGRVEPELTAGLQGQSGFDRAVAVTHVPAQQPREMPSQRAMAFIRAEVSREELVDQAAALKQAQETLMVVPVLLIEGRWTPEEDRDEDGREDMLSVLGQSWCADGGRWLSSERLRLLRAGSASDVLEEWAVAAGGTGLPSVGASEPQRRQALLVSLKTALAAEAERPWLLTMSNLDGLGRASRWMLNHAVATLQGLDQRNRFVFTTAPGSAAGTAPGSAVGVLRVGALSTEDVAGYLGRYYPSPVARGQSGAELAYADYKRLAQGMETELRARLSI